MKHLILTIALALVCAVGCAKNREPLREREHLKVVIKADGTILANGAPSSLEDLARRLDVLKEKNGMLWYHRPDPEKDPPPNAMEVIKLAIDRRLPIAMFKNEDFSGQMPR